LAKTPDGSYDVVISTLTVAHIKNIREALHAWCRILKKNADIIITDFHPGLLGNGGKRNFIYKQKPLYVTNYIHPVETIENILAENGFIIQTRIEKHIDENVKPFYEKQNALHVFEKFKGMPVIYGLHLKRSNGIS